MALRERILEVSREIVRREGFASLSMRKLAGAIDYSPAALYLHFRSRSEIARALSMEGHLRLREAFVAQASIAEPAARLHAMARAYVEFGLAEPQTYRLMFMEPAGSFEAATDGIDTNAPAVAEAADAGAAMLAPIADAFLELRSAGRLPPHAAPAACAEGLWASLHGVVALKLNGAAWPATPAETLVELLLEAWCKQADVRVGDKRNAGTKPRKAEPQGNSANRPDTSTR
ncbi:TetR/AcrR family transcriptional regulator [Caballeronia sp. LZ065]|uniref:TetR/AcrR family transcriptional regulator n=1 Tax=Caballeronia sp. LZ065 TaxID=3038571 RepID=UPI0028601E27|nr:TetR/AcrR family transcriptional regulator [Caballeronia sp. LZ065]MDR5779295.1 TetR/AcrR family transcriptional regulator [Caballeronia sp. LZ065]